MWERFQKLVQTGNFPGNSGTIPTLQFSFFIITILTKSEPDRHLTSSWLDYGKSLTGNWAGSCRLDQLPRILLFIIRDKRACFCSHVADTLLAVVGLYTHTREWRKGFKYKWYFIHICTFLSIKLCVNLRYTCERLGVYPEPSLILLCLWKSNTGRSQTENVLQFIFRGKKGSVLGQPADTSLQELRFWLVGTFRVADAVNPLTFNLLHCFSGCLKTTVEQLENYPGPDQTGSPAPVTVVTQLGFI